MFLCLSAFKIILKMMNIKIFNNCKGLKEGFSFFDGKNLLSSGMLFKDILRNLFISSKLSKL